MTNQLQTIALDSLHRVVGGENGQTCADGIAAHLSGGTVTDAQKADCVQQGIKVGFGTTPVSELPPLPSLAGKRK